ncbi:ATP-binding protein [Flavobacterium chungangensis]|uniref:histidine kinase n=1 Tax=Flavobacterium chungangensis TaxID=2708132 RepID=A0ABV8Z8P6_9FLAO
MYDYVSLLKNIVDNTPLPIAVLIGTDLKIELANPAMISIWGKGNEVIGHKYFDVLPETPRHEIMTQALEVLNTGIPFYAKDKLIDLIIDGKVMQHYFNYSFTPLYGKDGNIYGLLKNGTDITDLHNIKQKIQSSDERLRIAVESSGMGTYEINLITKETVTSGNFNELWSVDEASDTEMLLKRMHPEDLPIREKAHQDALTTGKIVYEARIINDDKSERWVKVNGKIIKDQNGNASSIIGIIQDISDQRKFEKDLQQKIKESTKEIRESNENLIHFANMVTHDLKEPVRKIKIFNGLLKKEIEAEKIENIKKYSDKVDQSAERMQTLIEGTLAYSTLNKSIQQIQKINLNEIIENIKIDLELIIQEKDAILFTSELPEIEGAPILIHQLFYNLIHNALKFSKADEPPRVIITSKIVEYEGKKHVQIVIKDNGIGLDSAYAERIFNAFERLHSKDDYEGTGLGLALCRKITERHNGTITAAGQENDGAEFTVTLPLSQEKKTI